MKVFSTNKTALIIAAILAVSTTHQTNARLLEKENSVEGSDVDILEPLYPEERDLGIFEGGTEDSMRAARMEDLDMRAARMDDETLYRAADMEKSLYDAGRIDGGNEAARLDGGDEEELPREVNKEDSLSGAGKGALDVTIMILDTVVKCFLSEYIVQTLKQELINEFNIKIEYLECRNIINLGTNIKNKRFKLFISYYINKVRLIDNF